MKILSAKQLAEADLVTTKKQGVTSLDLMERAAIGIFNKLHNRLQGAPVPIKVICGIGNNGGDGLAIARHLIEHGYHVTTYVTNCSDDRSDSFLKNYERIKNITKDWPVLLSCEEDFPEIGKQDIVIDAIFGTGLNRPVDGWMHQLIEFINKAGVFVISIDIPSGMFANYQNEKGHAIIRSSHTFTFETPKLSFFMPSTGGYVGNFEIINLALDPEYMSIADPLAQLIGKQEAKVVYRPRPSFSNKYDYGHVLVFAGSTGKMGAAVLTASAAINSGAGLVTAYVPKNGNVIMQTSVPEVMTLPSAGFDTIEDYDVSINNSVLCAGPGLGTSDAVKLAFAKALKAHSNPAVLDADALNLLALDDNLWKDVPQHSVLTPHDGELARLVGVWKHDYERIEKAIELSKKRNVVMVLKGAYTVVVSADQLFINDSGNPGMATAGTGDVLTGVIAAYLAQGYESASAAVFSVFLHGFAGDLVAQTYGHEGLKASLIANYMGSAMVQLFAPPPAPPTPQPPKKQTRQKRTRK